MFDDSGVSLSASDPNPTIDQIDDGGSHSDFSTAFQSAMQWGTEIAGAVSGAAYQARSGAPIPPPTPAVNPQTKLLMLGLGIAAAVAVIYYVS